MAEAPRHACSREAISRWKSDVGSRCSGFAERDPDDPAFCNHTGATRTGVPEISPGCRGTQPKRQLNRQPKIHATSRGVQVAGFTISWMSGDMVMEGKTSIR